MTGFVSNIFDGIGNAIQSLVDSVKGFVNGVIGNINAAIDLINLIPGVNIPMIPYLLHGTKDWGGGLARVNEGGRGELIYLPNGSQVIPHDISVKYAKEAARSSQNVGTLVSSVQNTEINFNGSYQFQNQNDVDYFMNQAALRLKRGIA